VDEKKLIVWEGKAPRKIYEPVKDINKKEPKI